jgi:hypothetical protein
VHLAIDAEPHEPLRAQVCEQVVLLAFAPDDRGRKDHQRVSSGSCNVIDHLRLCACSGCCGVGSRIADARQQAQVIDLGHCADGGRGLWLVAFARRYGGDRPSMRSTSGFHQLQELARTSRND